MIRLKHSILGIALAILHCFAPKNSMCKQLKQLQCGRNFGMTQTQNRQFGEHYQ